MEEINLKLWGFILWGSSVWTKLFKFTKDAYINPFKGLEIKQLLSCKQKKESYSLIKREGEI